MQAPFIYIASLRRTGSTVLAEALTQLPYAFILREPGLGRNKFNFKPADIEVLEPLGIDLRGFARKWGWRPKAAKLVGRHNGLVVRAFKKDLIPRFERAIRQVGVKEIRHFGWRHYLRAFPDMRVVLTARDPRDVYISLHNRLKSAEGERWRGEFNPATVAADLDAQFRMQLEMAQAAPSIKIRYEDLCTDPVSIEPVKAFVQSPVPAMGNVGGFLGSNPRRQDEFALHGNRITDQRVNRWQREANADLLAQAQEAFDRMDEYCKYWGYAKSGDLQLAS